MFHKSNRTHSHTHDHTNTHTNKASKSSSVTYADCSNLNLAALYPQNQKPKLIEILKKPAEVEKPENRCTLCEASTETTFEKCEESKNFTN